MIFSAIYEMIQEWIEKKKQIKLEKMESGINDN